MEQVKLKLVEKLAKYNTPNYNILKAVEELSELSTVLLQYVNKLGSPKEPPKQAVIDEIGDVLLRVEVLKYLFGPDEVRKREALKEEKLDVALESQRYENI